MSDNPWFKFYASDWLAGTRGLSAAETGVYITLIATMYERGGPISTDYDRLARLCGTSTSGFKKSLAVLIAEGKIIETEHGLWNDRAEKEINFRDEKTKKARASSDVRWNKKKEKIQQKQSPSDANALRTHKKNDANQKPDTRSQIPYNPHTSLRSVCGTDPPGEIDEVAEMVRLWNRLARTHKFPIVQRLTPARRASAKARLKDAGGLDGWKDALEKIAQSSFLRGDSARGNGHENWVCNFDFLMRQGNFTKLLEGMYDDQDAGKTPIEERAYAIYEAGG